MLNRQKVLLHFLRLAGRPVSRYELTKWSFLLRHETESCGGSAFYDFLPYQYGPFSFSLYQELDKLEDMSYVQPHSDGMCVLDVEVSSGVSRPPKCVMQDIDDLLHRFERASRNELTDHVYERHPGFTVNSKIRKLQSRPIAKPAVFTAGYEGLSVDAFINLLVENGIRRLVDVRKNPVARRYGFHRSTLNRLCGYLDIEYVHEPDLGIASEKRRDLADSGDYEALFRDYENTTLKQEQDAIERVTSFVQEKPSVLVCMEADPVCCHRSRLARVIAERSGLPIRHLGTADACC